MKRTVAITLLILLILSFAGCKEKDPTETPTGKFGATLTGEGGSGLYTKKEIPLLSANDYAMCTAEGADGIYIYCATPGETPTGYIAKFIPETGEMETIDYSAADSVSQIFVSNEGSINTLEYRPVEGSNDLTYFVREISPDGTVANESNLDFIKEHENSPIVGIVSTEKGLLVTLINSVVLVSDGKITNSFECRGKPKKVVRSSQDSYLICGMEEGGYVVEELSPDLKTATKYTIDGEYSTAFGGLGSKGVYLADSSNLYSVDYKTGEREPVVNFVANGVSSMGNLIMLPDKNFFTVDRGVGSVAIWSPGSVSAEDIVTLKLATFNSSSALTETVLDFNSQSEKYKIDLVDYSTYNTGDDLMGGLTKLNTEIIAGNYPDIFDLSTLSADTYSSRGALEDLRPFIDADEEFEYDDFVGSVMETLSDGEKLYQFVPGFVVDFIVGDASVLGDVLWTPERFLTLAKESGDKSFLPAYMTREDFISYILSNSGEDFISKKNKTCSFDNEAFSGFLEYASRFPPESEMDYQTRSSLTTGEFDQILSGNQLLLFNSLRDAVSNFVLFEELFDQNRILGFPTNKGTGYAVTPHMNLGMSSSCENKEGIWEFFRFMLSDSYQGKMSDFHRVLPVLTDELDKYIEKSIQFYSEKEVVEFGIPSNNGIMVLKCDPPDSGMPARIWDIINKIDRVNRLDETVYDVVMDEAGAYFAGEKSLNEVTSLIQSRLQLYVSEQG